MTSSERFDHPRVAKSISGIVVVFARHGVTLGGRLGSFVVFAGHGVTLSGRLVYNAGAHSHGSHTLETAR